MDTPEGNTPIYISRTPAIWRAIVLSLLIGCVLLVLSQEFKGNLAELQFAVSYMVHIIVVALIAFPFLFPWRKKTQEQFPQAARTAKTFVIAIVMLSLIVIGKIAHDFPNGEGLFHPTLAASIKAANTACLTNLETDAATPQVTKDAFCSCFADQFASALAVSKKNPLLLAERAREACLGSPKP